MKAQKDIMEVVVKESVKNLSGSALEAITDEALKSDKTEGIINKVRFKKVLRTLTLF